MPSYESIDIALGKAVERSQSPGGVLYVGDRDQTYLHTARGLRQREPRKYRARKNTLYDLASLTKVVARIASLSGDAARMAVVAKSESIVKITTPTSLVSSVGGVGPMFSCVSSTLSSDMTTLVTDCQCDDDLSFCD